MLKTFLQSLFSPSVIISCLLLFFASLSAWSPTTRAGDLSGSATYNYNRQEEDEESFFSSEVMLQLNWLTAISNNDKMNFYVQYFREDTSSPETEQIRPLFGLNISGKKYRWVGEYRELEQKNLGVNAFTQMTELFFSAFRFDAGEKYPDLRLDFTRTTSQDDLEVSEVDFTETDWGIRTTYNREPFSVRYGHRENDFDNHLKFLTTTNLQIIQGVATDLAGVIYVTDSLANRVFRFSPSGAFLGEFGNTGSGQGQFRNPIGIDVQSNLIYVVDSENHRVQRLSLAGDFISEWGSLGFGQGEFNNPYGVAVDDTGVYISDQGNDRIQKFTLDGAFLFSLGTIGTGSGFFSLPSGIASNGSLIFIADTLNHRIQVFDTDGTYVTEWGSFGTAPGQFQSPTDVAIDSIDHVYVTDNENNRIQVFTTAGAFLEEFGVAGSGTGEFNDPRGIAITLADDLAVIDTGNNRFQVLTNTGLFRFEVGTISREERARSSERTVDFLDILYAQQLAEGVYASLDYDLFHSEEKDKDAGSELASALRHDINALIRLNPLSWMTFTSMLNMETTDSETRDLKVKRDEFSQTHMLSIIPVRNINATATYTQASRDNNVSFDEDSRFATFGLRFRPTNRINFNVGYSNQQNEQNGKEVTEVNSLSAITNMRIYQGVDFNLQFSTSDSQDFRSEAEVGGYRVRSRLKLLLRPRLTLNTSAEYNTSDSKFADLPDISTETILSNVDFIWGIGERLDLFTDFDYIRIKSSNTTRNRFGYFSQLIWRMNEKVAFFMGYRGSTDEEKIFSLRAQAQFPFIWNTRLAAHIGMEKGEVTDRKSLFIGLSKIL